MREILFRGKRIDNNEWSYGDLIQDGRGYVGVWAQTPSAVNYEVEPETVGQYTGLTDKNGKRIFEGDIIRYCERFDYQMYQESIEDPEAYGGELYSPAFSIGAVVYYTDDFSGFDISNHNFDSNGLSELMCSGDYFYEVIGNLWDNPELLEGDKT